MTTLPSTQNAGSIIEQVVINGDLSKLTAQQRTDYYGRVCESLGLNPYTKPFAYIELNGALTLYARRDATDQLRKIHGVSTTIVSRERMESIYIVTARATTPDGRTEESIGAVPLVKEVVEWKTARSGKRYPEPTGELEPLAPGDLANALMKAETKAKRRVTLSIVGLGWLDETEVSTVPGAQTVDMEDAPNAEEEVNTESEPEEEPQRSKRSHGWANWPEDGRKAFWARMNEWNLKSDAVHRIYGLSSMKHYPGTMEDAKDVMAIVAFGLSAGFTVQEMEQALGVEYVAAWEGTPAEATAAIHASIPADEESEQETESAVVAEAMSEAEAEALPF